MNSTFKQYLKLSFAIFCVWAAVFILAPALQSVGMIKTMHDHIEKILFEEPRILARLDEIAAEITRDYQGKDLIVVPILHGGLILVADLLRRVKLPLKMECLSVASYHGGTESSGQVTFNQLNLPDLGGAHVLVIDDILDSGRTLDAIALSESRKVFASPFASDGAFRAEKPRLESHSRKFQWAKKTGADVDSLNRRSSSNPRVRGERSLSPAKLRYEEGDECEESPPRLGCEVCNLSRNSKDSHRVPTSQAVRKLHERRGGR